MLEAPASQAAYVVSIMARPKPLKSQHHLADRRSTSMPRVLERRENKTEIEMDSTLKFGGCIKTLSGRPEVTVQWRFLGSTGGRSVLS